MSSREKSQNLTLKEKLMIKPDKTPYGYLVEAGYIGFVPDMERYMLFSTEEDYIDYISKED